MSPETYAAETATYPVRFLEIQSAVIDPNPANINGKITVRVVVVDEVRYVEPFPYYTGEVHSGEV